MEVVPAPSESVQGSSACKPQRGPLPWIIHWSVCLSDDVPEENISLVLSLTDDLLLLLPHKQSLIKTLPLCPTVPWQWQSDRVSPRITTTYFKKTQPAAGMLLLFKLHSWTHQLHIIKLWLGEWGVGGGGGGYILGLCVCLINKAPLTLRVQHPSSAAPSQQHPSTTSESAASHARSHAQGKFNMQSDSSGSSSSTDAHARCIFTWTRRGCSAHTSGGWRAERSRVSMPPSPPLSPRWTPITAVRE